MRAAGFFPAFRIVSYVVLLLMLAAGGYAFFISMVHWSGIGV
jgi:hypothetical protein